MGCNAVISLFHLYLSFPRYAYITIFNNTANQIPQLRESFDEQVKFSSPNITLGFTILLRFLPVYVRKINGKVFSTSLYIYVYKARTYYRQQQYTKIFKLILVNYTICSLYVYTYMFGLKLWCVISLHIQHNTPTLFITVCCIIDKK